MSSESSSTRNRRSKRIIAEDEDDVDDEIVVARDDQDEEEEQKPSPRKKSRRSRVIVEEEGDDNDEDGESAVQNTTVKLTQGGSQLAFCSQAPEATQDILPVRDAERAKFLHLGEDRREKMVLDTLRLVLFKALSGDPIDRLKIIKDAGIDEKGIAGAVFEEVNVRLQNVFGFCLQRAPKFLIPERKDSWYPKYVKDRYYLVNIVDDADGQHAKSMYMVHQQSSMEKGLLMTILGFIFCHGHVRADNSRWLLDKDLYRLLHLADENMPPEPPIPGNTRPPSRVEPDVDASLDRFCKMDYLVKIKSNEQLMTMNEAAEDTSFFYALGARSAVEIGRKQVVHFISQSRTYM